jgi:hypothetical protein
MTPTDARTAMKSRLDIISADTTFDDFIDQCVLDAVDRFAPTIYREVAPQVVAITPVPGGQAIVDLSALSPSIDDIRELEAVDNFTDWALDQYQMHGDELRIREVGHATSVRIYGVKAYELSTIVPWLRPAVYFFAQAIFYTMLMANKSKYNVYMQNGRGAVDNMQDLVDFWDQKGMEYLQDKGYPYGR